MTAAVNAYTTFLRGAQRSSILNGVNFQHCEVTGLERSELWKAAPSFVKDYHLTLDESAKVLNFAEDAEDEKVKQGERAERKQKRMMMFGDGGKSGGKKWRSPAIRLPKVQFSLKSEIEKRILSDPVLADCLDFEELKLISKATLAAGASSIDVFGGRSSSSNPFAEDDDGLLGDEGQQSPWGTSSNTDTINAISIDVLKTPENSIFGNLVMEDATRQLPLGLQAYIRAQQQLNNSNGSIDDWSSSSSTTVASEELIAACKHQWEREVHAPGSVLSIFNKKFSKGIVAFENHSYETILRYKSTYGLLGSGNPEDFKKLGKMLVKSFVLENFQGLKDPINLEEIGIKKAKPTSIKNSFREVAQIVEEFQSGARRGTVWFKNANRRGRGKGNQVTGIEVHPHYYSVKSIPTNQELLWKLANDVPLNGFDSVYRQVVLQMGGSREQKAQRKIEDAYEEFSVCTV